MFPVCPCQPRKRRERGLSSEDKELRFKLWIGCEDSKVWEEDMEAPLTWGFKDRVGGFLMVKYP